MRFWEDNRRSDQVIEECQVCDAPVGSVLLRHRLADNGRFGVSEGVRVSGLSCQWRVTAAGGEVKGGGGTDVEASRAG